MADTIVALSSGPPPAAIGVIRLSGPSAIAAATAIAGKLPAPRRAGLRRLRRDGAILDQALVLVFPGPDSATGEDLVEFHVHGGPAVVRAVQDALLAQPGVIAAEAGAFTRRALMNGRIDLTQVEGLSDLLTAETQAQHRAAIQSVDGLLRRSIDGFARRLLGIAADVELALDFTDEEDSAGFAEESIRDRMTELSEDIRRQLAQPLVENLQRGFRVVLAGSPNRGKSTLLNALAGREAAIVSPIAGTTRDRIEVQVSHGGLAFVLIDTAGIVDDSNDPIETIGVERARDALAFADVVLWLEDDAPLPRADAIRVAAQTDRGARGWIEDAVAVSSHTGTGLDRLWAVIHQRVQELLPPADGSALNHRQHAELAAAASSIEAASIERDLLLCADNLRSGLRALDRITGAADTEAMLDQLFARFCIGK